MHQPDGQCCVQLWGPPFPMPMLYQHILVLLCRQAGRHLQAGVLSQPVHLRALGAQPVLGRANTGASRQAVAMLQKAANRGGQGPRYAVGLRGMPGYQQLPVVVNSRLLAAPRLLTSCPVYLCLTRISLARVPLPPPISTILSGCPSCSDCVVVRA
jgi:hypothetical protein